MQPNPTPLRLSRGVGDVLFGTLHCERRLAGAVMHVEKPEGNQEITDITLQGSAAECCTAVLQVLHHASAAYSQNNDLSSGNFAQPAWQFTHKDQQEVLSTTQLTHLPLDMFAPDAPCMHLPSSCFLTLPLAVQCCQLLAQGQVQQSAISTTAEEYEDKDGDVLMMADDDVEQLVASLQAARHTSSEWENMGGLSSISMLLFGHQATADQEPSPMDFAITKPGAVRLYVVLDTSVLLSHWSFIQALHRNLGQDGAVQPPQAGSLAPAVQLLLVVPWAVLVELDKLKGELSVLRIQGGKKDVAPLARRAIKGLASMLSKDRCLQYQSETDALKANKELGSKGKKTLNDDSIIYCGMDVQRRVREAHLQGNLEASKSGAVLLTKDNNMCLKAQANGLKAMSPAQFPAAQPHLHKRLLAISSETSPVRHTPTPDASPPPPPQPLSDLCSHSSQGNITLPSALGQSPAGISQLPGTSAPAASKHDQHSHITSSSSNEFAQPTNTLTQLGKLQQPEQPASFLHPPQQLWQADPHLQQQQHHQQQQRQPEPEDMAAGSFKLQGAPMLPSGLVTGSHGYPRAPSSTPAHLQPSSSATGQQQQQQQQSDTGLGLGLGLGLHHGLQHDFAGLDGSMQHQQGGFPGNLLPSQSSNGRRLTSSTSMRDHRAVSGQGLHSAGSTSALGALTTSNSSGTGSAQELNERVWGVLVEGLQPFMQWELQSGMGDFWEQAILVAPPWDVADMMAVMKKDMSGTLHGNAELSRCHSRLAAAVKARERPTSLSLAADLASNVSSVLLMLPLPAKTDKVAHVKSGAVTGLEARLALQKGREEAQRLFKLASTALQQQQQLPRSASFPSKGRPTPIEPTPSVAQASGAAGIMAQKRSPLPLSNGLMSHSSATLDPIFTGTPSRHARQPTSLGQLQAPSALLSNPAPLANIWQQPTTQQDTIPASFSAPTSRAESAVSSYLPQQQNTRGWSGPVQSLQAPMPQSTHQGENGNLHDSLERHHSGSGLDLLQSAQGLLQIFGKCAAEHLSRCEVQLQQHPADAQAVQQASNIIADAAKLLLHAIAIVHASEPPQHQVEVVKQCAQNMLLTVFWVMDQQQAPPAPNPALVKELCIFFTDPESAQAAANVAQHLQHMAQSVMGR